MLEGIESMQGRVFFCLHSHFIGTTGHPEYVMVSYLCYLSVLMRMLSSLPLLYSNITNYIITRYLNSGIESETVGLDCMLALYVGGSCMRLD